VTDNPENSINPESTRIGWIGTGVMGRSMCGHLVEAGYSATVFNRSPEKTKELVDRGATLASSPREVALNSDVVFTIVGFPSDVESVILGADGVLAGCTAGMTIVDMTTSRPALAAKIAQQAAAKEVASIDAPVSGGDTGARNAALSIMIGGDAQAVKRMDPLLQLMGKTIVHQGGPGSGQHTKMVNQTLIASGMIAVCEAMLYAHKIGLDLPTVLKSVASGGAASWALSNLAPRMIENDFDPGFFVEHFIKDMRIALDEAAAMNLSLPGLALAHQLYQAVAAQGHDKDGTQALVLALAKLNNIDWKATEK
jgi:3-hydroxyisobutyrate dehydrogenase